MPLEISFPRRRVVETKIDLPKVFKVRNLTNTISGPAAELRIKHHFQGATIWLEYDYRSLTDYVPETRTAEHFKSLDRMENAIGYVLTMPRSEPAPVAAHAPPPLTDAGFNWPMFWVATLFGMVFSAGAALACWHHGRVLSAQPPPLAGAELRGLGGWLVLIGLRLVFSPILQVIQLARSANSLSVPVWHSLTTPGSTSYHAGWLPLLTFELLAQIGFFIFGLFLLVLFFQKRRPFPIWYIVGLSANLVYALVDGIGTAGIKPPTPDTTVSITTMIFAGLIGCAIWIPYMLLSRRVKSTFIR
jgi:hypothetical protein